MLHDQRHELPVFVLDVGFLALHLAVHVQVSHVALVEEPFEKGNEGFHYADFQGAGGGYQSGNVAGAGDSLHFLRVK